MSVRGERLGFHCAGPGLWSINISYLTAFTVFQACFSIMDILMPTSFGEVKPDKACRCTAGTRRLGRLFGQFSQNCHKVAGTQRCTAGSVHAANVTPLQSSFGLTVLSDPTNNVRRAAVHGSQARTPARRHYSQRGLGVTWRFHGAMRQCGMGGQVHGVPLGAGYGGHVRPPGDHRGVPSHPSHPWYIPWSKWSKWP